MIREGLNGHHQDNEEVSDELMYWFLAHYFGFTPQQVDEIPYDRVNYMILLEEEFKKKERQLEKNGI